MLAAKSHEAGKSKAESAPDKTRGGKETAARQVEVNPIWQSLATGVPASSDSVRLQTKLTVGAADDEYE